MVAEENYVFKADTKRKLLILAVVGLIVFAIGVFLAMRAGTGHGGHESTEKASAEVADHHEAGTQVEAAAEKPAHEEHEGNPTWVKRIFASLWMNNIFFTGIGIIGLFFIAIHFAAQAGWSAPITRIP